MNIPLSHLAKCRGGGDGVGMVGVGGVGGGYSRQM